MMSDLARSSRLHTNGLSNMTDESETTTHGPARLLSTSDADLDLAASLIRAGGLVAMPTETVYGLAADATNARAIADLYTAKGRPSFNPLICHVASLKQARALGQFNALALKLAEAFWPGPLTLVVPRADACPVADLATAGLRTIALRIPKNLSATGLITRVGRPLAAPSANPSERLSPTLAGHVMAGLGDRIDAIIDDGATPAGLESSVVAAVDEAPVLLRVGALAREIIEAVSGPLRDPEAGSAKASPGMLARHYAPRARLRLNAIDQAPDEAFLAFGEAPADVKVSFNLSSRGDLAEAASNLFAMLHRLDESHVAIAVARIPNVGLGEAINDRLTRAADAFSKSGV